MFTNTIRKISSKIVMASMLFSVLAPLTGYSAIADGPLGTLRVGFDHASGGYTIKNVLQEVVADRDAGDCPLQSSGTFAGYYLCQEALPIGTYTVTFNDVDGYSVTEPVHVALLETPAVNVFGDYEAEGVPATGVLGIGVNNANGGYIIKNVLQQQVADVSVSSCSGPVNGYYICSQSLPAGTYTVEFDSIPGYNAPATAHVALTANGYSFNADYTAQAPVSHILTVNVDLAQGGYTVTNVLQEEVADVDPVSSCGALQADGYYHCSQALPAGTYTVSFNEVNGYNVTDDIHVVLTANTAVQGDYTAQAPVSATLTVGVNLAGGGFTVVNVLQQQVAEFDPASDCGAPVDGYYMCSSALPLGTYTVRFNDVTGYNTPSDIHVALDQSGTVWGFYSTIPTGVIQVRIVDQNDDPITDLPANEWQLKRCSNANPASCTDTLASGGAGGVYDNLLFDTYRIHFPNAQPPAGYTGRTVIPSVYQVLNAQNNTLTFTIKYTRESQQAGVAYVNVETTPVPAQVRMVTTSPAQPTQSGVTSDQTGTVYDLSDPDRFTLPTTSNGYTEPTDYYIECLPAPGGYLAPANIVVNDAQYGVDTENLAGQCVYTHTDDVVTITVDTVGVEQAAIYVDGVEVRPTTSDAEVPVIISTEEQHVISFEDKDPANYAVPENIVIPAGSLDSGMTADELRYLGVYVALGNLAVAEVNTENQNGWVYLTIGSDPTLWNVGLADTTATPLIVQFDETVAHQFHFQDRNTAYYLRAVPVADPGFSVAQDITLNGDEVTHFQEYYVYAGGESIDTVYLTGDYIAQADAAFFRARTTNADPVFGEIYLDINGEPTETLVPGAQTWTRVFISDVVNDDDTTSFQSPIMVDSVSYTAVPAQYELNTFSPSATINDLESTYYAGGATDLTVQLLPAGVGSAGLNVTLDSTTQPTVDNAGTFQTTFAGVDPNTDHTVICPAIAGYATPNDLQIAAGVLTPGVENFAYCLYVETPYAAEILIRTEADTDPDLTAPVTLRINGVEQTPVWTVSSDPNEPATFSIWIDTRDTNVIVYGDRPGYITPAEQTVSVTPGSSWQDSPVPNANTFTGTYLNETPPTGANLIFHLRELDPDNGPVANTSVTVNTTNRLTDVNGDTTFSNVLTNQVIDVTFGNHPLGTGAYATPLPLQFQPGELQNGQTYEFTIYYVPVPFAVILNVETLDEPTQTINVNGAIYLVVNGSQPTLHGFGTASIIVSNDSAYSYDVDWGPTYPTSQYIEPAVDPQPVDVSGLSAGEALDVTGLYRLCTSGNCEVVTVTAWDETGSSILSSASITINGAVVGNGQHTGTYDVGTTLNIEFEDVATHGTPDIHVNGVSVGTSHTTSYTVLDAPSPNTVDAYYPLNAGNTVGFNVSTRDNQNHPLTEAITHGITGTETTEPTPALVAVDEDDLDNYTINFADRPGYITPGSVVVVNQAITSIPNNVLITLNGTPYVAGDTLTLNETYDIVATYIPHFVVQKTVISEQTIANNNKRVDYRITVTRHPDTAAGTMSVQLHDSIADSGRTISGTNGGTMSVVPQNGAYSTCSNGCGDITAGTVTVNIDNPGTTVTIDYQALSNNNTIPASQSSNFTNTVTGTYTNGGQQVQLSSGATVNVLAAPSSNGGGGSGGGSGGGGGHILIRGDMVLEITKLVSINNRDWFDASDEEDPFVLRERYHGPLYTKVTVKNLGQVTATNIRFTEGFDEGDSRITSEEIENVQGEDGFEYNETTGEMRIDQLSVNEEIEFSYEQTIDENGSQGELAEEYLVLEGFSTKLSPSQDGLTKHGIGDHYPSWLTAGTPETPYEGSLLGLEITSDKSATRIGDEVIYYITATNNADFDLTGVIITWDYDESALEILNSFGGRNNGTEIHWDRGILRPGQSAEYQVRVRVTDGAPVGGNVRTTARGLVNELENPATAEHFLTILAGLGEGPVELAQTGMPTFFLILASIFAYFAYTQAGRRRYLALRRAALRPF